MSLSKKAPNFNKKEEIFVFLCEYQVPMLRATWFIKLSSAYTVAVSEAKIKKRQMPDPTTEWTGTLLKFLKDQVPKLHEYYSQSEKVTTQAITTTISDADFKSASRHWNYCTQLLKYMYEEGLMDRQEVLNWILEHLEKMRSQPQDDGILKLYLPLALQYLDEFVQSELLSRRLAYFCCKKLGYMLNNVSENLITSPPQTEPPKTETKEQEKDKKEIPPVNPMNSTLTEYQNCPHHRDISM